ncbi:MAG: tetratricopeptide repeat protein [Lentisphaerae bacterium]|nr:tetratricopeptide repeat protein [Lentisphaerota bacterium]
MRSQLRTLLQPGARVPRVTALLLALLLAAPLQAIDESEVDFAVLEALHGIEMLDYAEILVEQMEAKYPKRRDEILIEKARTLYRTGKTKPAEAALEQIKPASPYAAMALLLRAEVAAMRGQNDAAAKVYAQYFAQTKPPQGKGRAAEAYARAVSIYSTVLKRQGKGAEAAKVLELLAQTAGADDRKLAFLKGQAVIDSEEGKFDDKKPVNRAAIQAVITQLQELLFLRDGVAVSAYLETARAHILLAGDELNSLRQKDKGKDALKVNGFKDALRVIDMADKSDLLADIEKEVASGADRSASPYAGALFYKGEAYRGLALAHYLAGDNDRARKIALAAAKLLETVVTDYGESEYRMKALTRHGRCSSFLEQAFGEKVALSDANVEAEVGLKLEQAQAFLQNKNYQGAIPLYLEALRLGRRSKRLPEVASPLIVCLGSTDRFLEAQAIASYLAQVMPQAEGTADCLFRLGGLMYEKAKGLQGEPREAMLADAMAAWELFVETASDHPKAPDVAFAIAEHHYRLADELVERSRKAPANQREAAKTAAREAFQQAAPKYQRLVERYSAIDKGTRALYKLGWIYYTLEQPRDAVDAFLRYAESETLPRYADDRLEAKFRAAEQIMLGDTPAEAEEQFTELLSWLQPDNDKGFNPASKTAQRLREDAASYRAWSLDLAGEKVRPALLERRDRLADLDRQRRQAETAIRSAQDQLNALTAEADRLRQTWQDQTQALGAIDLDFAAQARAEAAKRPELDTDLAKLAADMEGRVRARVRGELAACAEASAALAAEKAALETKIGEAKAQLEAATQAAATAAAEERAAGERLQARRQAAQEAEKAIVEGEAASRQLEEQLQQIQEQQAAAEGAAQQALEAKAKALAEQLAQRREKLAEAYKQRDQIAGAAAAASADLEAALAAARDLAARRRREAETAQHRHDLVASAALVMAARLQANDRSLAAAEALDKALATPAGAARDALAAGLKAPSQAAIAAWKALHDEQTRHLALQRTAAEHQAEIGTTRLQELAAQRAEVEGQMKPLQETMVGWKRRAQEAFESFLKAHPKSSHVPKNLARLGAIFLELEAYDQASAVLNRLAREFPDSEATQEALFGLGRAQWEQGQTSEAAQSFAKLLEKPAAIHPGNLAFISERLLDQGDPAVSLAASRELLARTEAPKDPEAQRLRERAREAALFRAGQACLRLKAYDDARRWFTTLLTESPRTGFFFDAKFGLAQARRQQTPPDLNGALAELAEIIQFSEDPVQSNHALCWVGEALAAMGDPRSLQQAVARYQQVVLLADPTLEANQPWLEMAIAESAVIFNRLGQSKDRDAMLALYRERFPNGSRAAELQKLPRGAGDQP